MMYDSRFELLMAQSSSQRHFHLTKTIQIHFIWLQIFQWKSLNKQDRPDTFSKEFNLI